MAYNNNIKNDNNLIQTESSQRTSDTILLSETMQVMFKNFN